MSNLYLKKSLGQHFLKDESVLHKIAEAIGDLAPFKTVVEIGPGMGALTNYLLKQNHPNFFVVELDDRWAEHLSNAYPALRGKIIHEDFLTTDLNFLQKPSHIVGNFPYNISSQIVFRIIDEREKVERMTGMFQKEVALRIAAKHGSKDYGVTSVLTQAYYHCQYLFDVLPESFNPPPKVMSGIIQLTRKTQNPNCDELLFKRVVKAAFNQRRKTMRNSLKEVVNDKLVLAQDVFNLRPEQISVTQFQELTNMIQNK
ncbi:MAG: 16S rRNA (adenine(1518)-N(6)/adenine(1519)-N(6))-dimethyltransferase RsmA [Bacteroidota bacterium]